MLLEERLSKISQIVDKEGSATIDFLAQKLEVSKDTIRRDLIKLESRKKIASSSRWSNSNRQRG